MNSQLKEIIILTINNVYRKLNININTFKKKYEKKGKYSKDKRKQVYKKKSYYYNKENVPANIRRIKKRDPKGWKKAKQDYYKYEEAVYEQKQRVKERKAEQKKVRKEIIPKEKQKPTPKDIRVWMKLSYRGENPIFIEAFVEGTIKEESDLKRQLREFIASNFNEEIMFSAQVGTEYIEHASQTSVEVQYKHSLAGSWSKL